MVLGDEDEDVIMEHPGPGHPHPLHGPGLPLHHVHRDVGQVAGADGPHAGLRVSRARGPHQGHLHNSTS